MLLEMDLFCYVIKTIFFTYSFDSLMCGLYVVKRKLPWRRPSELNPKIMKFQFKYKFMYIVTSQGMF